MWTALDEKIAHLDTPIRRSEYHFGDELRIIAATVLLYGLPILVIITNPTLNSYFGVFSSFFFDGALSRTFVVPSLSGLFLDALIVYIVLFTIFPKKTPTKDRLLSMYYTCYQTLHDRALPKLNTAEQTTWRLYLLKLFFVPLMVSFLFILIGSIFNHIDSIYLAMTTEADPLFAIVLLGVSILFLIDVGFFVFGYLTESERLDNSVTSVDPTVSGWLVCLICYPPFNVMTAGIIGGLYEVGTVFNPYWLWILLSIIGLLLLAFYAAASVNLFGKASNLTYRGLVTHGTYGLVRHPAYATKVASWTLISLPFVVFQPWLLLAIVGWTIIYILRALTEERHIKMVARSEYEAYERNVPYRFIPYVV